MPQMEGARFLGLCHFGGGGEEEGMEIGVLVRTSWKARLPALCLVLLSVCCWSRAVAEAAVCWGTCGLSQSVVVTSKLS